jgi:hypothetical protein
MATQRVPGAALWQIDINLSGQSDSPGLVIQSTDKVTFDNLAPFPVSIQFICANGPVFNDIPRINASSPEGSSQQPQQGLMTVDYVITNLLNDVCQGPYGIQVSVGSPNNPAPLLIPITAGNPPTNQATMSVPLSGWIEFDLDQAYTITWTPAGAFNTPAGPIGPGTAGPYRAQTGNQTTNAAYKLVSTNLVTGGGTVKIRS